MILIVDDDENIVHSLCRALSRRGYDVKSASNGVAAFEMLRSPDCRCMLLDVNMPKVNGVELLLLMQAEGIEIPTIVMAGFQDFAEDEMKQFDNVVKFFGKPFPLKEMIDTVAQYAA
jgi:two-component system, LuxR family, response regulator FixJ